MPVVGEVDSLRKGKSPFTVHHTRGIGLPFDSFYTPCNIFEIEVDPVGRRVRRTWTHSRTPTVPVQVPLGVYYANQSLGKPRI